MTAETYDRLSGRVLRGLHDRVTRDLRDAPHDARVLDVGTGTARLLRTISPQRPDLRLTGVDISPRMVALARQRISEANLGGRIEIDIANVTDLPYQDSAFSLVVSTLSLHHWPAVTPSIAELLRVLRPDGRLLIYDFRAAHIHQAAIAVRSTTPTATARISLTNVPLNRWLPLPLFTRLAVALGADGPTPPGP